MHRLRVAASAGQGGACCAPVLAPVSELCSTVLFERVEPIKELILMHVQQPYVPATEHLAVMATIRGQKHSAVVLGWRGDRVCLTWRTDLGSHLGWVAAADVERLEVHPADGHR